MPVLDRLEKVSPPGHSRNGGSLASCRISTVLELALEGQKTDWEEETVDGSARADLQDGAGEPTWGAPRIHEKLLMLGFEVSERTISR